MLRVLAEHRVEFVIIGGFALSAHGVIRGTKDIDIMPDPRSENIRHLAGALRALSAEVMLAEDFDPSELGLAPDEDGLSLGGNWSCAPVGASRHHVGRRRREKLRRVADGGGRAGADRW
ncbi:MAG: hypothetical protein ACR2L8_10265 [Solirubrobacteraceae bacterium]